MMKLDVPFYKQTTNLNCGPAALKMVLAYLGKDFPLDRLEKEADIKEGRGVLTIQLAIAAQLLGFKTRFMTKSLGFDPGHLELDFYQKYADLSADVKQLVMDAHKAGVKMEERAVSLGEIEDALDRGEGVLVLLDWNAVLGRKEKGYQGHFVPMVGYDGDAVYVHNGGFLDPRPNYPIPQEVFEAARMARGTDEDIVFVRTL